MQLSEVQAVFTTAGDPDVLVWLQVPDVERLGQVIEQLRRRGRVTGTKTLIVLDTWSRPTGPSKRAASRSPSSAGRVGEGASAIARGGTGHGGARSARDWMQPESRWLERLDDDFDDRAPDHTDDRAQRRRVVQAHPCRAEREPHRRLVPCAGRLPDGLGQRPDLSPLLGQGHRPRTGRPCSFAAGRVLPVLRRRGLLRRRAEHQPGCLLQRFDVAAPGHTPRRPGHHGHRLHRPDLLHDDRRRGQCIRIRRAGLVRQPRGLGAANQISCVSPAFCIAAEGGPSVWNGHTWTQPNNLDSQGQLNAVSCATTTFCVLVDSSGSVLTWNGLGFTAPRRRSPPSPRSPAPTPPGSPACPARPRPSAGPWTPSVCSAGTGRPGAPARWSTTAMR